MRLMCANPRFARDALSWTEAALIARLGAARFDRFVLGHVSAGRKKTSSADWVAPLA